MPRIVNICAVLLLLGCSETPTETSDAGPPPGPPVKMGCAADGPAVQTTMRGVYGGNMTPAPTLELTPGQELAVGALGVWRSGRWLAACSGTLIAPRWVLTAAHCVIDFGLWDGRPETVEDFLPAPNTFRFLIGDDLLAPQASIGTGRSFVAPEVQSTFVDRRIWLSSFGVRHDLALIALAESATEVVPQIEPILPRLAPLEAYIGQDVTLGGYGISDFSPNAPPNEKRWWAHGRLDDLHPLSYNVREVVGGTASGDSGGGWLIRTTNGVEVFGTVLGPLYPLPSAFGPRTDANAAWISATTGLGCGEVDQPTCRGNALVDCRDGHLVEMPCSDTCVEDLCGVPSCGALPTEVEPGCADLDYAGRCDGDRVQWCVGGKFFERDCALESLLCRDTFDDSIGYDCVATQPEAPPPPPPPPPPELIGCGPLDDCMRACGPVMWCALECLGRGEPEALAEVNDLGMCLECQSAAQTPYFCWTKYPRQGACGTACRTTTSTTCDACLVDTCEAEYAACG